jgi:hypothetical protein
MNTIDKKANPSPQIRIFANDKLTMENLAQQWNETLPATFHRVLSERPKLHRANVNYLKRLSERTGKGVWDLIDGIIFEHQQLELGRQFAAVQDKQSDDHDALDAELMVIQAQLDE